MAFVRPAVLDTVQTVRISMEGNEVRSDPLLLRETGLPAYNFQGHPLPATRWN